MKHIAALLALAVAACQTVQPKPAPLRLEAPEGYVVTPHGLVHETCVREAAPDETIDASGKVIHADGTVEQLPPCTQPRLHLRTLAAAATDPNAFSGWAAEADWTYARAIGSMSAQWTVPANPATWNGATIFYFPGTQPRDGSTILQPVLGYGKLGTGSGWTIASWYCCPAGYSHRSPLVRVNPGDAITGTVTSTCTTGSCNWAITTAGPAGPTTLKAANVTTPFTWNFGGVLELKSVSGCDELPASGTTTFSNIVVKDLKGNPLVPRWSGNVTTEPPPCSYAVSFTANSVTVSYSTSK